MKRITLLFGAILLCVGTFAQLGYYYNEEFVELETNDKAPYLVITYNEESRNVIESKLADQASIENTNPTCRRISKNRYILDSKDYISKEDYISEMFYNNNGSILYILPRIILATKEEAALKCILDSYKNVLSLLPDQKLKGQILLSCHLKNAKDVLQLANNLRNRNDVEWCEPDMLCQWKENNTFYSQQYYLKNTNSNQYDLNVEPAWTLITGNNNITVAVIDCGTDHDHEDLSNSVLQGYTIDSIGNGRPTGVNVLNSKSHGTACAGIIGAEDNTIGIKGVACGVKILPVNIVPHEAYNVYNNYGAFLYTDEGFADNSDIAYAIQWAYERADILSLSWGEDNNSASIGNAINDARTYGRNGKGCVVVAASGNSYPEDVSFPARLDGVLAVGAIYKNGNITDYSQRGSSMGVVAFGGNADIVTTDRMANLGYNPNETGGADFSNTNYTKKFSGTSAACPQVAGVAALMLSADPELSEDNVRLFLQLTARDLGATGFDTTYGYGLVDAYAAVKAALMSINGSSVVCGTQTYYVSGLPTGMSVSWSLTFNSGNSAQLATNTPATNQCQVTRTASTPFSATLTATITYQGQTIKTLTKALSGNIPIAMSFYTYSTTQGSGGQPHTFGTTNYINVSPNTYYYVTSPSLPGMTLTPSFPSNTPGYTMTRISDTEIEVSLPPSGFMTVAATGSNCDNFSFAFAASSSKSYALDISGDGEQMRASLVPDTEDLNARNAGQEEENVNWTLEVYETTKAELTATQKVEGLSCTLDTSRWKPGIYIIRALIGDETLTEKINLK